MMDNTNVENVAMSDALDDLDRAIQMLSLAETALEKVDELGEVDKQALQAALWLVKNAGYVLDLELKADLAHV